tara:strand:+ start:273 stop:767 length:495 start_codon:yes stop_codon:yes gene_type:complete
MPIRVIEALSPGPSTMPPTKTPPYDITKARVRNGYGITTSRYSISELGYDDKTSDAVASRPKPPSNVHVYSKLHYPSLRSPHLQVCYPETVAKLQPPFGQLTRKETPSELKRFSGPVRTRGMRAEEPFEREFPSMAKTMAANTRLAEAQRKENHARSRICQISF